MFCSKSDGESENWAPMETASDYCLEKMQIGDSQRQMNPWRVQKIGPRGYPLWGGGV